MKKFEEVYEVDDYEVYTPEGWINIEKTMLTEKYDVYEVKFDIEGLELKCADKHILMSIDNEEVYAIDSVGKTFKTIFGPSKVVSVTKVSDAENMYDLQLSYYHQYYTNGVVSHNTTVVGGYLLHLALFNSDFTIACLANKRDQAAEILVRIKLMYERLPWFLQLGVSTWNKSYIVLGNNTRIFISATGGSAVRGKSLNCFGGQTGISIQHKITKKTKFISFEELEGEFNADLFKQIELLKT